MASALPISSSLALNPYIDYSLLAPAASETDVRKVCEEAWSFAFRAVCVPPVYVKYTSEMLEFCPVPIQIITVIGYPMGYSTTETKLFEADRALANGAHELDVVLNLAQFKSMAYLSVQQELQKLADLTHARGALLKVTLGTPYLDRFELQTACEICAEANVDLVKTATKPTDPTTETESIAFLRDLLPDSIGISAAAEHLTRSQALEMIAAGAARLDTCQGVALMESR